MIPFKFDLDFTEVSQRLLLYSQKEDSINSKQMHKKSRINYATDHLRFLNSRRLYMRNRLSAKMSTNCGCYILQAHPRHPKYQ